MLGKTNAGDALQVALPWEAEPGKLEGRAELHQSRELIKHLFHPFAPTHMSLCLGSS